MPTPFLAASLQGHQSPLSLRDKPCDKNQRNAFFF